MTGTPPRYAVACDHAGLPLKATVLEALAALGVSASDLGTHDAASVDYPDFAHAVALGITAGTYERGILICGSGVGMSIAANRHPGIRAALCTDSFTAAASRAHNDANVLCLGARVVGPGIARDIVEAFVRGAYEGGRHQRRVDKIER